MMHHDEEVENWTEREMMTLIMIKNLEEDGENQETSENVEEVALKVCIYGLQNRLKMLLSKLL